MIALLVLSSCETEQLDLERNDNVTIQYGTMTRQDFENKKELKFQVQKVDEFLSESTAKQNNAIQFDKFELDLTSINTVVAGDYESYTFFVIDSTSTNIRKNLVINKNVDGSYVPYLFEYVLDSLNPASPAVNFRVIDTTADASALIGKSGASVNDCSYNQILGSCYCLVVLGTTLDGTPIHGFVRSENCEPANAQDISDGPSGGGQPPAGGPPRLPYIPGFSNGGDNPGSNPGSDPPTGSGGGGSGGSNTNPKPCNVLYDLNCIGLITVPILGEEELWRNDISNLPTTPCGTNHDCVQSIKTMASGLQRFHGEEGAAMAAYFEDIIFEIEHGNTLFTISEIQAIYDAFKLITEEFNSQMRQAIIAGFGDGVGTIVEIALFEVGGAVAVKLIQKIPVSWVYRGTRLNNAVLKVGGLGVRGSRTYIREVRVANPVTHATEIFNSLTKHKIGPYSYDIHTGARTANMGNGNYITFRNITQSSSNVPATIDLNFPGIWPQQRVVKFLHL